MYTSEQRDSFLEAQDRLIDLFVQHDEASRAEDWGRVHKLKTKIAAARLHRDEIRRR